MRLSEEKRTSSQWLGILSRLAGRTEGSGVEIKACMICISWYGKGSKGSVISFLKCGARGEEGDSVRLGSSL
jgi:hypothetical protein